MHVATRKRRITGMGPELEIDKIEIGVDGPGQERSAHATGTIESLSNELSGRFTTALSDEEMSKLISLISEIIEPVRKGLGGV